MKKVLSFLIIFGLIAGIMPAALASGDLPAAYADAAKYFCSAVSAPTVSSAGGEWGIIALARGGYNVPDDYFDTYYSNVVQYTAGRNGVLHQRKYTEYARVSLALTAIGRDPRNVGGFDLLMPLGDYDKTVYQGITGAIWALIALDAGNYAVPQNTSAQTQATRELYIDYILSRQLSGGGFSLNGKLPADPDVTAMALQALSRYEKEQKTVSLAIDSALSCLSTLQNEKGGFTSFSSSASESTSQVIIALRALSLPIDDSRFVKSGGGLESDLMSYYLKGEGFAHAGSTSNLMATEQALCALAAAEMNGYIYDMRDVSALSPSFGLPGRHKDIVRQYVVNPDIFFTDTAGLPCENAAGALYTMNIVNGRQLQLFVPNGNITRAEFAAIIVRALGLTPKASSAFSDVSAGAWYAPYVGTAYTYGIITGVGNGLFDPSGDISRQEAALMLSRAGELCGMNATLSSEEEANILSQYAGGSAASWAKSGLAFCLNSGIFDWAGQTVLPTAKMLRGEMAISVYNLLKNSALL